MRSLAPYISVMLKGIRRRRGPNSIFVLLSYAVNIDAERLRPRR